MSQLTKRLGRAAAAVSTALAVLTAHVPIIVQAQAPPVASGPSADAVRKVKFTERDRLYADALKLREQGKLVEAIVAGEQMLAINRTLYVKPADDLAFSLDWLGQVELARDNFVQAEKRFQEALEVRVAVWGHDHWKVTDERLQVERAQSWSKLPPAERAELSQADDMLETVARLSNEGRYAAAIAPAEKSCSIYQRILGQSHLEYAQALNWVAGMYQFSGDYARAEPGFVEALEIRKQALGEAHPDYATSLNNLALLYKSMGNYARAEPLYKQALKIEKKVLGESHLGYAIDLNNLALLYKSMGDYARAEPLYKQALEIRKKALGQSHPDYAGSLNSLAALYADMGDYARAEPLYKQALEIRSKALGESHPDYATSLNNLAVLYDNMGDYARAEPLYQQALEIRKKALGESHPEYATSLNNLALLYQNTGDYARAEPLYQQALEIRKKALGEIHPGYALSLNNLAMFELAMGQADKAEQLLRSAVLIRRRNLDLTAAVQSERQQLAMVSKSRYSLDIYVAAALAAHIPPGEVYTEVAAWKGSISAQQQLVRTRQRAQATDPNSDLARLFAELEQKTRKIASLYGYTPKPEEVKKFQQAIHTLGESIEALQQKLSQLDPDFHRIWAGRSLSSDTLRQIVPTGTALVDLLEYDNYSPPAKPGSRMRSERRYVAFIIRSDKPVACMQLGPAQPINDLVDAWREGFGQLPASNGKLPGDELRRLVWKPIAAALAGTNITLISPDSSLARLPWAALPGEKPNTYLIEERAIAVVPVPQRLPETLASSPVDRESSLLLVGNVDFGAEPGARAEGQSRAAEMRGGRIVWPQLAGTKTEIDELKTLFSRRFAAARPDVLEEKDATEDGVRRAAGAHRYLHLATHGFFAPSEVSAPPSQAAPQTPAATPDRSAPTPEKPGRVGVKVEMRDGRCTVREVIAGAAAAIDGRLHEADELVTISTATGDWYEVAGKEVSAILAALRGPTGSTVRLKVRHHDKPDQLVELALKRTPLPATPSTDNLSGIHPSLMSGIVLAGANRPLNVNEDDGILTAFEVAELPLEGAELITLSACETGLGESAGGEGLLGLQRAFQIAGARTVISGLWKVPDRATQMLMVRFYENLWQKKLGKLAALREAQIWMLRQVPKDPQLLSEASRGATLVSGPVGSDVQALPPSFWAAFVLSGDWR